MAGALSLAQARELSRRARAAGIGEEDPLRDVTVKDVRRLGYSEYEAGHIVSLLGRERQLDGYLLAAEKADVAVITRLDARFPQRLREQLGARCPAALFCRGDLRLLQRPCISVVGSRHLASPGAQFAAQAGRLAAREGFTLCSGDAMGADRTAQEACLSNGGSVLIFPATELVYCPVRENVLYAAEGGFRVRLFRPAGAWPEPLHPRDGRKDARRTDRASARAVPGAGALDNLQHEYSPLFVFDDGSEGARALCARGATPVQALTSLQALTPAQLSFDMQ